MGSLLGGCASIVDGNPEKLVAIHSTPPGAKLTVFDKQGHTVLTATTPVIVGLPRHHSFFNPEVYRMRFEYPGYYPSETFVSSKVDKWYLANIYSGGPIGFFAVDPATGAMWTLPTEVNRNLTSMGARLTHEELKAAEKAANPNDQWRESGIIEKDF
jgi:hypothetical protein